MSTASTIIGRIVTTVATVSGLSSDKVIRGIPETLTEGGSPPVCWVYMPSDGLTSEHGPELTSYSRTLTVHIEAAVAAGSSHADREDAALTMLDGLMAALEADTTLLGYLTVAPVVEGAVDLSTSVGMAAVGLRLECRYMQDIGGGI
jgi:hypothetical protein